MPDKSDLSLSRTCFMLTLITISIFLDTSIVRSQALNTAADLTQTLPQARPLVPQIILPPRPETPPLPAPQTLPSLPPSNPLQPSLPSSTPNQKIPELPGTITVKRFAVIGSTIFSRKVFAKEIAPFVGTPLSFSKLEQLADKITKLYTDKGYITSGAYIAPQNLQQGIVIIKVVEGRLEQIRVTGTRRLSPNYVRSRLKLATSTPLNRNHLVEALQLLQLNPLIKNISADLSPGSQSETVSGKLSVFRPERQATRVVSTTFYIFSYSYYVTQENLVQ